MSPELNKAQVTVGNPSADNSMRITSNSILGLNQGVFSYQVEDVISSVIRQDSPLLRWLPVVPTTVWNEKVAHLTAVFGKDFDGSETYLDFISASNDPAECEYGEGGMDFQTIEYSIVPHRITTSNKNNPLNRFDFGGVSQWQKQPILRFRGDDAGLAIQNDAEWALAMLGRDMEEHVNWCSWHGDADIPSTKGMFFGLDSIIREGYVAARAEGKGDATIFTDPDVYSGVAIDTPQKLLTLLRNSVRRTAKRLRDRGGIPQGDDMVIFMPPDIWEECAEVLAAGYFDNRTVTNIEFHNTPEVFNRMKEQYMNGGLGMGYLPVFGVGNVPIMTDTNLGVSTTSLNGKNAVTGDIYVLTKRFRGMNILEIQYMNWNALGEVPIGNSNTNHQYLPEAYQNGVFRGSWVEVNSNCFYYGMESWMRIVSRMQPAQVKITDVTIEVDREGYMEAGSYTHQNFYPFSMNDAVGGQGTALIEGIIKST